MIFSLGYLVLAVVRWVGKARRRNMFRRILSQYISKQSICIQKRSVQSKSSARSYVKTEGQFREKPVTVFDQILITAIEPKQTLNLTDWTAYLEQQGRDTRTNTDTDVTVLLEAVRPDDLEDFVKQQLDVPLAEKIHVLNHGIATAWKPGAPFGIIYQCSLEELITLAIGMEDGYLTLDEDLEVNSLKTISTIGDPVSLVPAEVDKPQSVFKQIPIIDVTNEDIGHQESDAAHLAEDIAHTLACDRSQETWSNESLASNSSVGRVELLDPSELDRCDGHKGETDFVEESGCGESLSEMNMDDFDKGGNAKPPNVLIYTGKTDTVRKYEKVKEVLEQCLDPDCYVIYHLKHEELETSPWIENTSLLVLSGAKVAEVTGNLFLQYFYGGGKVLSLGTEFDSKFVDKSQVRKENWISEITYELWKDVVLVCARYAYNPGKSLVPGCSVSDICKDKENYTLMVKVNDKPQRSEGCAILSQVLLEADAADVGVTPEIFNQLKKSNADRFEILSSILSDLGLECNRRSPKPLTPAGLVTKSKDIKEAFLMSIEKRLTKGMLKSGSLSLNFGAKEMEPAEENLLPVLTENTEQVCSNFNEDDYMNNLHTSVLGNTVIYVDIVPSTMPLLDGMMFSIPNNVGLIAIARQQTSGKGRGGNSWLSPVGCAMFSLHVKVPLDSNLGRCVSYLQHITSLAVVYSVCQMDGYKDINLRLKWPNDIYYGQMMKLGGVIVRSTILDGMVHAIIGCGFNVENSNPTICINDVIQSYNRQFDTQLQACTTEQLLAGTVSWIEKLIDKFQRDGPGSFQQMYYDKWLHSDKTVTLQSEGDIEVKIVGLDEHGYLLVQKEDGQNLSVQPDGNSFDMMRNLITLKTR